MHANKSTPPTSAVIDSMLPLVRRSARLRIRSFRFEPRTSDAKPSEVGRLGTRPLKLSVWRTPLIRELKLAVLRCVAMVETDRFDVFVLFKRFDCIVIRSLVYFNEMKSILSVTGGIDYGAMHLP